MANTPQQVVPTESQSSNVNVNLAVSNTDIVTMLMEEQKTIINKKLEELKCQADELIKGQSDWFFAEMQKQVATSKLEKGKEIFLSLAKLLMPKRGVWIHTCQLTEDAMFNFINSQYMYNRNARHTRTLKPGEVELIKYRLSFVRMEVKLHARVDDIEQDEMEDDTAYPHEQDFPVKVRIEQARNLDVDHLIMEMDKLRQLIANEQALKDKIVARVTKNAIAGSDLLIKLTGGINLLEDNVS
jgi:hypothetical protein